jgi:regulator of sirC expression with transglutaminase-like and TPR domain
MRESERFAAILARPDAEIRLDEAALCLAASARPGLDRGACLAELDALAASCPGPTLDHLVDHLFESGRLRGNRDAYDDPDNSLLDQVLARGLGIPITLSLVAMEVGRRIGVPLSGVGMPGHFLLRDKVDPAVFVDPFHGGRLLDAAGCRRLHAAVAGPGAPWDDDYLAPVPRAAIVRRMLENLMRSYDRRHDLAQLGWVLDLRRHMPGAGAVEERDWIRFVAATN